MLLENQAAIVTGGAGGMGKATALKFAGEGCNILVADLQLAKARQTADEIKKMGRKAAAVKADISKKADVDAMAAQAIAAFGRIDILVNCAGGVMGIKGGDTNNCTEEDWQKIIDVNLKGTFLACMSVIPQMKKQKYGKIVIISSMGAVSPATSVLHYHSAKAGVIGLSTNLAFELAPFNIHSNVIVPGPIETTFWDGLMTPGPERDKFFAALAKQEVPLGRMGKAEDIAGPALFLASGLSDFVTGQVLYVAGGQPLLPQAATFLNANRPA
jgi:NAD(P)-dependent dehydrogenase (short-subunit alcohol dehydrogenase family)